MNALDYDSMMYASQRSDKREDQGQRWCSFHVAFAGKI